MNRQTAGFEGSTFLAQPRLGTCGRRDSSAQTIVGVLCSGRSPNQPGPCEAMAKDSVCGVRVSDRSDSEAACEWILGLCCYSLGHGSDTKPNRALLYEVR